MTNHSHEQLLISRIIDGDASEQEWNDLESLALREPQVWRELAEAQRDHAALVRGIAATIAVADDVAIPTPREIFSAGASPAAFQKRLYRLSAWAGWAVAALVVLAMSPLGNQFRSKTPVQPAGFGSGFTVNNADDALDAYMSLGKKDGRVLEEVPQRVMVQSQPLPSGEGFEIIFVRQIIEKTTVPDLYQFSGQDDRGQPTLVKCRISVRGSM